MIHVYTQGASASNVTGYEINVSSESLEAFKEMVQRATNLWPDAPMEIKTFSDIITNGQPMQNYLTNPHLSGKAKKTNT